MQNCRGFSEKLVLCKRVAVTERLLANMSNVTSQNVLETRTLAELLSSRQNATVVVEALLSVILNIAASFLNCVLCWAVYKSHRLRRMTSVYVLVLALTDLLTTNVQCWPQDPYFPFSSLVPHFSEVWKCGKV